jgi:hypothetical protein
VIYKAHRKNPDTGDEDETTEEDQLLKFITVDGVTEPWVIDHYVDGKTDCAGQLRAGSVQSEVCRHFVCKTRQREGD